MVCNFLHISMKNLVTFILLIILAALDYGSITTAVTVLFDIANAMFRVLPQPLITVTITNDAVAEDDEDFTLALTPFFANGISLSVVAADPNISRVIILDEDGNNYKQPPMYT